MYCWSTQWWGWGECRAGMRGKRRHSQYPFLPRHLSEKEQRDKRSRWMEMELMLKESLTGSNKSWRVWATVSDGKSWAKMGHELEADMEAKYKKEWLGTGSAGFDKGSDWGEGYLPTYLTALRSCSSPHLKMNQLSLGLTPGQFWTFSVNLTVSIVPSPIYSGHGLRSSCLRWISGSHMLRIHLQEGLDFHSRTHTHTEILPPPTWPRCPVRTIVFVWIKLSRKCSLVSNVGKEEKMRRGLEDTESKIVIFFSGHDI